MAHAIANTQSGLNLAARIRGLFENIKAGRAQRREYNRTVRELSALTDRELLDLGLSRYDIHDIARRHVYGA